MKLSCTLLKESGQLQLSIETSLKVPLAMIPAVTELANQLKHTSISCDAPVAQEMLCLIASQVLEQYFQLHTNLSSEQRQWNLIRPIMGNA